ncbi:hypothetical protein CKY47_31635 [Saccharothrix yanglingensis]|uniref:Uncharacterized protein n=1 Tax=Saccharothrix yanglingensis TaxID=659496 RepID=A0ABU0X8H2_9PSEU|nr:hypothetical protein [Saccharothrix yanglingensis]
MIRVVACPVGEGTPRRDRAAEVHGLAAPRDTRGREDADDLSPFGVPVAEWRERIAGMPGPLSQVVVGDGPECAGPHRPTATAPTPPHPFGGHSDG